jgi:hypothetical protein
VIGIKDADKAEVLMHLYNYADMSGANPNPIVQDLQRALPRMSLEHARAIRPDHPQGFDYIGAKSVKVNLSGDEFDAWMYDRDNGEGAARRALQGVPGVVFEPEEPTPVLFERG